MMPHPDARHEQSNLLGSNLHVSIGVADGLELKSAVAFSHVGSVLKSGLSSQGPKQPRKPKRHSHDEEQQQSNYPHQPEKNLSSRSLHGRWIVRDENSFCEAASLGSVETCRICRCVR